MTDSKNLVSEAVARVRHKTEWLRREMADLKSAPGREDVNGKSLRGWLDSGAGVFYTSDGEPLPYALDTGDGTFRKADADYFRDIADAYGRGEIAADTAESAVFQGLLASMDSFVASARSQVQATSAEPVS